MQKLNRKTRELVEATLMIGISRTEAELNSSYDSKKEKIKGSIENLTNRQIKITRETCIDFLAWHSTSVGSEYLSFDDAFDAFEKQYTEQCNGNCGMNYCDENGCSERERHLTGSITPQPEIN